PLRPHPFLNQTLISHGLLGSAPIIPSLAFPIHDLEVYRRCHIHCPQFSIQQWIKVICDISNINYRPSYRTQFSDAFDTYLELRRMLEKAINKSLERDKPNWRLTHSCPACHYKVADEPELSPSIIGAIDGNNSLKRFIWKDRGQDDLVFDSDYFLSREFVDKFGSEVKVRKKGDPTDGNDNTLILLCTDNWKAANAETLKRLINAFEETGIFLAICRHGMIWIICNMVRSGELAKYPLATCAHLLGLLPKSPGLGYDIACSFGRTLARSSLGPKAKE
ncbi:hypothetical protein M422DRAFT_150960, partial [Sphaerobolus stellatus SS14]